MSFRTPVDVRIDKVRRRSHLATLISLSADPLTSISAALNFWHSRHDTMVFPADAIGNLLLVKEALSRPHLARGAIVEFGTWRGGMSAMLSVTGGVDREYYFFDSFAGLPPPTPIDGLAAAEWAAHPEAPRYFDNCRATEEEFREAMRRRRVADDSYRLFVGPYSETIRGLEVKPVSVVRLDSDWYASTLESLSGIWPFLLPGALVIVDDYFHWEGCRKAVHRFLAERERPEPLETSTIGKFAYFWKSESEG